VDRPHSQWPPMMGSLPVERHAPDYQGDAANTGVPVATATSLTSEPVSANGEQYLFFLLAGQEYALKAEFVQSVERPMNVTPVPNTAAWVLGVVHLHGAIVSVVDLRALWGLGTIPPSSRTRFIVAQAGEMIIALVVDSVVEMRVVSDSLIQEVDDPQLVPSWLSAFVTHVAMVDNRIVLLLDVEQFFSSEQLQQYVVEE